MDKMFRLFIASTYPCALVEYLDSTLPPKM